MKKSFIFLTTVIYSVVSFAQKNMDGLINAEKSFAAYSVSHSTKEAFMQFLDSSSGMMFEKGNPIKAIDFWNKREKRPGILNWHPVYGGIASSGDFGFTSGPWTFQATMNDSVVARGQYTTIWHVDKNGQWKFLVDLGNENSPRNDDTSSYWTMLPKDPVVYRGTEASMLQAENDFIKKTSYKGDDRTTWYMQTISSNWGTGLLNRNGRYPAGQRDQLLEIMNREMPSEITYTINGSFIASSGDMGVVYGTTVINGKTENYMRIWRKQKEGWKIAIEVLRY